MATSGNRGILVSAVVTATVTAVAIAALSRIVAEVHLDDVVASVSSVSWVRITLALAATTACYVALSGYDLVALAAIGRPLPWRTAAMASTSAYALSHNIGFAALTGTWARHRIYSRHGVGLAGVARIVLLTGASFWLGVVLMLGICLILVPEAGNAFPAMTRPLQVAIGLVVVDVVVLYLWAISRGLKTIGWGRWTLPLPSLRNAVAQCCISLAEMALSALVLWLLLPSLAIGAYPQVLVAYVAAFVAVLLTHAPGGAGVLETVVIVMLPEVDPARLLGGLILFRIIFHLLPLAVAAAILLASRRR